MKTYRHIYFDLDRTLWDYDNNSAEALREIYDQYQLAPVFASFEAFHSAFAKYNDQLWEDFREGRVPKNELRIRRFGLTLEEFGRTDTELATQLNKSFLNVSPRKTRLLPGAIDILEYLRGKRYKLYIITNGFTHIQRLKTEGSGLSPYFERMFTSDNVSAHKPHREMFARAVTWGNARKADCLMVGDDLQVDIIGARNYGMDQVYYNPQQVPHNEKVTFEIKELSELKNIL
jgi:putative hydrolase of the HAD superfamily